MKTIVTDGVEYVRKSEQPEITGEYFIVRTEKAGVFSGYVDKIGGTLTIRKSRRLWYWKGAASLSQLAMEGVKRPDECKFGMVVPETVLFGVIEIITATEKARVNIEEVQEWKQ